MVGIAYLTKSVSSARDCHSQLSTRFGRIVCVCWGVRQQMSAINMRVAGSSSLFRYVACLRPSSCLRRRQEKGVMALGADWKSATGARLARVLAPRRTPRPSSRVEWRLQPGRARARARAKVPRSIACSCRSGSSIATRPSATGPRRRLWMSRMWRLAMRPRANPGGVFGSARMVRAVLIVTSILLQLASDGCAVTNREQFESSRTYFCPIIILVSPTIKVN